MGVKQSFENLSTSIRESNKAIVGGVVPVTPFMNKLNKYMIPRGMISAGIKKEVRYSTKYRCQFVSKLLQKSGKNTIRT